MEKPEGARCIHCSSEDIEPSDLKDDRNKLWKCNACGGFMTEFWVKESPKWKLH